MTNYKFIYILLLVIIISILICINYNSMFTIIENYVYTSKKNLTFAINFVATPFLGGSFFLSCYTSKSLQ